MKEKFKSEMQDIDEADMEINVKRKIKASKIMVERLQKLFAAMLLSNFKYQSPLNILEAIVDDDGRQVPAFE